MWLEDLAEQDDPARVLAAENGISRPLTDAAGRYREAYPGEVEPRIALHRHNTAAAAGRPDAHNSRTARSSPRSQQ
jgi:hypothetical protein